MSEYYQKPHRGAREITEHKPPLSERYAVRALVSAVFGLDYHRHIHRAKVAARREEFEQDFEHAQRERARRVRV